MTDKIQRAISHLVSTTERNKVELSHSGKSKDDAFLVSAAKYYGALKTLASK